MSPVPPEDLLRLFGELTAEIQAAVATLEDRGLSGLRETQYRHDVVADEIVRRVLSGVGLRVLSEESGLTGDGPITVVVDPVDGSTNASLGLPWYATSLCAVDAEGPLCARVENLATGERFEALRGAGATRNGTPIRPSGVRRLDQAIVGLSGWPGRVGGWQQYRALGAAALDLCAVAAGHLDGYVDCDDAHGVWDYLGGWLVCRESGAVVVDAGGAELVTLDPAVRRGPVAASTPELLAQLLDLRTPEGRPTAG